MQKAPRLGCFLHFFCFFLGSFKNNPYFCGRIINNLNQLLPIETDFTQT